jgi:hypothetical protein
LRHSEHAHLLSNIEKLTLPILGSMFPFWIPTGDLVCQLEATNWYLDSFSVVRCSSQSTFRRSSQAKDERAPGSSCPVHSGHMRPNVVAKRQASGSRATGPAGPGHTDSESACPPAGIPAPWQCDGNLTLARPSHGPHGHQLSSPGLSRRMPATGRGFVYCSPAHWTRPAFGLLLIVCSLAHRGPGVLGLLGLGQYHSWYTVAFGLI